MTTSSIYAKSEKAFKLLIEAHLENRKSLMRSMHDIKDVTLCFWDQNIKVTPIIHAASNFYNLNKILFIYLGYPNTNVLDLEKKGLNIIDYAEVCSYNHPGAINYLDCSIDFSKKQWYFNRNYLFCDCLDKTYDCIITNDSKWASPQSYEHVRLLVLTSFLKNKENFLFIRLN